VSIKRVGSYSALEPCVPEDCVQCGHAEWGDVLVDGVCTRCLQSDIFKLKLNIVEADRIISLYGLRHGFTISVENWKQAVERVIK